MKTKKLRFICLCTVVLLLLSVLSACSGGGTSTTTSSPSASASADTSEPVESPQTIHKLSFSLGDPVSSSKAIYYQELADRTYEATGGGLQITIFSGGTLFSHLEVREGVLSGATDIGWFCTPFAPGQYPLSEVLQMPLEFGNELALTYAYLELFKQSPELQAELSEIKVLGLYAGPMNLLFTKDPVTKPDDLKGFQIRTMSGVPSDCLTAWGASPVFIGATEIYEAMDKGVVQGFTFDWSGIRSNTLYEVFNYELNLPFYVNPFIVMMNKSSYDNIPAEYKEAFDEIWCSEDASFGYAKVFDAEAKESRQYAIDEYGMEPVDPDHEAFQVFADEYIADWVERNTTDTFDAGAYLELARELYAKGVELYPEG